MCTTMIELVMLVSYLVPDSLISVTMSSSWAGQVEMCRGCAVRRRLPATGNHKH